MAENEKPQTDADEPAADADTATQTAETSGADATDSDQASVPEFEQLQPSKNTPTREMDFSRFGNVHVTVTAELGRAELTLQELIGLAEGSVVELNRAITAPVELVAQGVPMGKGEVVVVDDQFAVRIKEIYAS